MRLQPYEEKRAALVEQFRRVLAANESLRSAQIKLSWSNWGFGREPLVDSAQRLRKNGITWIELHGNRYGADLGYRGGEVASVLQDHGIRVSGICGMFGPDNDLASCSGIVRQNAIDYIRRQLDLCVETGGSYMLIVPGAVGRPRAYDDMDFERSVETLQLVADDFGQAGIRAAIEPIRSAEVSIVHTVSDAKRYIDAVGHPAVGHINGDVYHMHTEESNVAEALVDAGDRLINLHIADSNRCALGEGSLDVDAVIMALYVIGYTEGDRFVTPEPLGPGGDPYPAMHGRPAPEMLDALVANTAACWRERESEIKSRVQAPQG
jgi:D-psicose/D-tagatose/L-ribulose 3-epimerase